VNHVDAAIAGVASWTDPHNLPTPDLEGVGRCAAVFWSSALLTGFVILLVVYGLKRKRGRALFAFQLLVGVILVLTALQPLVEFSGPAWHSTQGQDIVYALLHRTVSWRVISYYIGCCSGLGLLCYLTVSKRPLARRAVIWLIAPLTVGVAFMIFGSRWMADQSDANPSALRTANVEVVSHN